MICNIIKEILMVLINYIQKPRKYNNVNKWLKKQATYQLNYNKKEKKQFLPIYSEVPNAYQIDLTFFPR